MKKIISLMVCLVLMMSVCLTAGAAGTTTLNGKDSVTVGSEVELIVNVKDCADASSISVAFTLGEGVELVSGSWIKTGSIAKFDAATLKGALGGLASPDVNGDLFKLVVKAAKVAPNGVEVAVIVTAKKGSDEIFNANAAKVVKIACATHTYGEWAETKAPTCTEKGAEERVCSACGNKETKDVAALGHKYGDWTETKAPTCTEKGAEERVCATCQNKETKDVAALGHKYGEAVVTKEATETETGLKTYTCSVCGEKKEEVIPVIKVESEAPVSSDTTVETPDTDDTSSTDVDANADADANANADDEKGGLNTDILIIVILAVVLVGLAVVLIIKKRK